MLTGAQNKMMAVMPERTYDVGIAEQHAVTFSAGLANKESFRFVTYTQPFYKEHMIKLFMMWQYKI